MLHCVDRVEPVMRPKTCLKPEEVWKQFVEELTNSSSAYADAALLAKMESTDDLEGMYFAEVGFEERELYDAVAERFLRSFREWSVAEGLTSVLAREQWDALPENDRQAILDNGYTKPSEKRSSFFATTPQRVEYELPEGVPAKGADEDAGLHIGMLDAVTPVREMPYREVDVAASGEEEWISTMARGPSEPKNFSLSRFTSDAFQFSGRKHFAPQVEEPHCAVPSNHLISISMLDGPETTVPVAPPKTNTRLRDRIKEMLNAKLAAETAKPDDTVGEHGDAPEIDSHGMECEVNIPSDSQPELLAEVSPTSLYNAPTRKCTPMRRSALGSPRGASPPRSVLGTSPVRSAAPARTSLAGSPHFDGTSLPAPRMQAFPSPVPAPECSPARSLPSLRASVVNSPRASVNSPQQCAPNSPSCGSRQSVPNSPQQSIRPSPVPASENRSVRLSLPSSPQQSLRASQQSATSPQLAAIHSPRPSIGSPCQPASEINHSPSPSNHSPQQDCSPKPNEDMRQGTTNSVDTPGNGGSSGNTEGESSEPFLTVDPGFGGAAKIDAKVNGSVSTVDDTFPTEDRCSVVGGANENGDSPLMRITADAAAGEEQTSSDTGPPGASVDETTELGAALESALEASYAEGEEAASTRAGFDAGIPTCTAPCASTVDQVENTHDATAEEVHNTSGETTRDTAGTLLGEASSNMETPGTSRRKKAWHVAAEKAPGGASRGDGQENQAPQGPTDTQGEKAGEEHSEALNTKPLPAKRGRKPRKTKKKDAVADNVTPPVILGDSEGNQAASDPPENVDVAETAAKKKTKPRKQAGKSKKALHCPTAGAASLFVDVAPDELPSSEMHDASLPTSSDVACTDGLEGTAAEETVAEETVAKETVVADVQQEEVDVEPPTTDNQSKAKGGKQKSDGGIDECAEAPPEDINPAVLPSESLEELGLVGKRKAKSGRRMNAVNKLNKTAPPVPAFDAGVVKPKRGRKRLTDVESQAPAPKRTRKSDVGVSREPVQSNKAARRHTIAGTPRRDSPRSPSSSSHDAGRPVAQTNQFLTYWWHVRGARNDDSPSRSKPPAVARMGPLPCDVRAPWIVWYDAYSHAFSSDFDDTEHIRLSFLRLPLDRRLEYIAISEFENRCFMHFVKEQPPGMPWDENLCTRWNMLDNDDKWRRASREETQGDIPTSFVVNPKHELLQNKGQKRARSPSKEDTRRQRAARTPRRVAKDVISVSSLSVGNSAATWVRKDQLRDEWSDAESYCDGAASPPLLRDLINDFHCKVCAKDREQEGNEILLCDMCDQGFHQHCHVPPVHAIGAPEEKWFCNNCTAKLMRQRGMAREVGDINWYKTSRHEPEMPCIIKRIDFSTFEDTCPYWVTFFPDHTRGMWAEHELLKPWGDGLKVYKRTAAKRKQDVQEELADAVQAATVQITSRRR